jgi:hypothetical protein
MKNSIDAFTERLINKGESALLDARYYGLTVYDVIIAFENAGLEEPVKVLENTWLPRKSGSGGLRLDFGWGNGYVKIVPGHQYYKVPYDDFYVNVHGGLTFSEEIKPDDNYLPEGYWVGFDTAHSSDTLQKWSRSRVYQETLSLFAQLYSLEY